MHTEVNFGIRGRYKIRTCDPFRVREVRDLCANRPGLRADRPNRFSQPNLRADNGTRTRGLNLGKVALYQLSYVRMCYLHRQQVTKIRQSQEKAKPPRVPPVFQRLSSAEVKFPNYADVPSFMESGTVWASSLNAR